MVEAILRVDIGDFSIRQSQFSIAELDSRFDDGWFRDQFRCTKASFIKTYALIESDWFYVNYTINYNACFFIRDHVAVMLYYLMHSGSVVEAATVFWNAINRFHPFFKAVLS